MISASPTVSTALEHIARLNIQAKEQVVFSVIQELPTDSRLKLLGCSDPSIFFSLKGNLYPISDRCAVIQIDSPRFDPDMLIKDLLEYRRKMHV